MSDLDNRDDELVDALRRLPREATPPPHVAASITRSAAFTTTTARGSRLVWRVAVAASLVMAAFAAGRVTAPRPVNAPAAGPRYALLLYGGPAEAGDDRAAAYGAWARDLRRAGRPVSGERLADEEWTAGPQSADPLPLRGFFIIGAANAEEALALAQRHPHARDGTVVVRPIDTP